MFDYVFRTFVGKENGEHQHKKNYWNGNCYRSHIKLPPFIKNMGDKHGAKGEIYGIKANGIIPFCPKIGEDHKRKNHCSKKGPILF